MCVVRTIDLVICVLFSYYQMLCCYVIYRRKMNVMLPVCAFIWNYYWLSEFSVHGFISIMCGDVVLMMNAMLIRVFSLSSIQSDH